VIVRDLRMHSDHRGWVMELYRQDEMAESDFPVMAYLSETLCGVTRGPHEHLYQTDYFAFFGPGEFTLHMWDIRAESPSWGNYSRMTFGPEKKQTVLVPPGVVHAYENTGDIPAWVLNAPNRLYAGPGKSEEVDEIRHEDRADSPYRMN